MHNLIAAVPDLPAAVTAMAHDAVTTVNHVGSQVANLAGKDAGVTLNTTGMVKWIVKYIVPLVVACIGVVILTASHKGETGKNVITVGNMLLGIMVIAGGAVLFAFGDNMVNVLFS